MTETPTYPNVHAALAAAQAIMEPLIKSALNPAFKGEGKPKGTSYADLADVVAAVREPFAKCGLAHYSCMVRYDSGMDWRTSIVHGATGTSIECYVPLIVDRNNMQGMKSAITYAKRIGLESLAGLAPDDDDGNAASAAPPAKSPAKPAKADTPAPVISEDQRTELMTLFSHLNVPVADFLAVAKVADLRELPAAWFERARQWVNKRALADREAAGGAGEFAGIDAGEVTM